MKRKTNKNQNLHLRLGRGKPRPFGGRYVSLNLRFGWSDVFTLSANSNINFIYRWVRKRNWCEQFPILSYTGRRRCFWVLFLKSEPNFVIKLASRVQTLRLWLSQKWWLKKHITSCPTSLRRKQSGSAGRPCRAAPWQGVMFTETSWKFT